MLACIVSSLSYSPAVLLSAPRTAPRTVHSASQQLRMQQDAPPSLEQMESWTREYYAAARDCRVRSGGSMDEFLEQYDYFSEDYVLTGPDVGPLCKTDYVATQRGFTLDFGKAAPDLDYLLDGFHLDPDNPSRVWFTLRYVGTHTGTTSLGQLQLKPKAPAASISGGPEMHSIWYAVR